MISSGPEPVAARAIEATMVWFDSKPLDPAEVKSTRSARQSARWLSLRSSSAMALQLSVPRMERTMLPRLAMLSSTAVGSYPQWTMQSAHLSCRPVP